MKFLKGIIPVLVGIAGLMLIAWLLRLTVRSNCCQSAKLPPPPPGSHPGMANDTNAAKYIEYWEKQHEKK